MRFCCFFHLNGFFNCDRLNYLYNIYKWALIWLYVQKPQNTTSKPRQFSSNIAVIYCLFWDCILFEFTRNISPINFKTRFGRRIAHPTKPEWVNVFSPYLPWFCDHILLNHNLSGFEVHWIFTTETCWLSREAPQTFPLSAAWWGEARLSGDGFHFIRQSSATLCPTACSRVTRLTPLLVTSFCTCLWFSWVCSVHALLILLPPWLSFGS